MASIREIAKEAGVSVSTASKALNNKKDVSEGTKARVREVADKLGYTPNPIARRLSARRKNLIGLLILHTETLEIDGSIFIKILGEISREAAVKGYDVLLMTPAGGESYMEMARRSRVDGLIILGLTLEDKNLDELKRAELPMGILDQRVEGKCCVTTDNRGGIEEVVKLLKEKGHKEISFAGWCDSSQVSHERYDAYLESISPKTERVYRGGFSYEDGLAMGREIVEDIRSGRSIDAVVCSADMAALGVIKELQGAGIEVPGDVSVSGFDNLMAGRVASPSLTTVSQDTLEISRALLQGVTDLIEGKGAGDRVITGELIVRDSIGGRNGKDQK
ncbi:LacI family transcriptional regulator [Propionigenium maris DSM 9537]|uniref:LacI family transcriptional regulator n=1 Tax=Propionigenium maris DSM 9537 TaxID=1123000 RepID=A0A9W6LLG6_9FUSO|nr:LacI family DNA-binding transcriptional regulator [Propionigenium maris]GLI54694.1 LacI family transcriptional regulator [Propionigenium maris DSM 9537]